jgi:integrase
MEKGQNFNHPKKGSRIEVEPIRREKDIKAIIQLLSGHPRDHLLFVMGINNGIRVGDLLNIKVGDVRYLKPGQVHQITESKTKKKNVVVINKSVRKALDTYFSNSISQIENHHYLVSADFLFCCPKEPVECHRILLYKKLNLTILRLRCCK